MKFFIYIPGMSFDGNTIDEGKSLGGSESAGYYTAKELAKRGHSVFVFSNSPDNKAKNIDSVNYVPIGQQTAESPLGHIFEKYALTVPHDICLMQRAAGAFTKLFNSKLNYFWTHDLALKRFLPQMGSMLWNTDKIFAVSEWHKEQVKSVYNIDEDYIDVLRNGIDLKLFGKVDIEKKIASKTLLYSSRPERGLVNLVKNDGIMDQLYKIDPEIRLIVCGYDNNTKEMSNLYQQLWQQCEKLPNVMNYGHLSKKNLADLMSNVWLHTYPTEFEETSCITAMEEQAAGTPFVHADIGALSETLKDGGNYVTTIEKFTDTITYLHKNPNKWKSLHSKAINKAGDYSYEKVVDKFEESIDRNFRSRCEDRRRLFNHFLHFSDVNVCRKMAKMNDSWEEGSRLKDFKTLEKTTKDTKSFYENIAKYNIDIGNDHNIDRSDDLIKMPRLLPIIQKLETLEKGSHILDYGCCVGHITIALARKFPDLHFTGCDISKKQIDIGLKYIKDNDIKNIVLIQVDEPGQIVADCFDLTICCEVLEHIDDYKLFLEDLEKITRSDCTIIMSTPFGPMEAYRDDVNHPPEHLHHFEESDISEIIQNKSNKNIVYIADRDRNDGQKLGNYVWSWDADSSENFEHFDFERKLKYQNPRQEVSCCMILNNADSLRKTIKSIRPFVSEIIIGIDGNDSFENEISDIIEKHKFNSVYIFQIPSPLDVGFDEARNETIKKATKDWILWIDDDEVFQWPERIVKFIRQNQFDAYAIHQHHFSAEPAGLMKTDLPCRMFRNKKNIKFFGRVHEHPEKEINKGAGNTYLIPPVEGAICHNGYDNEIVRRVRFQRNFPLMQKDRKDYPKRYLGKFLWIRDLSHANRFEFEQIQRVTQEMIDRANEAIELWRWFLKEKQSRMTIDALPYISECVELLTNGGGYSFRLIIDIAHRNMGDDFNKQPNFITGKVLSKQDLEALNVLLINDKIDPFEKNMKYL